MPGMGAEDLQGGIDLVDWRRRVADMYRVAAAEGVEAFRRERDRLFADHPQSPIPTEHLAGFKGVEYFAPDPAFQVGCSLEPGEAGDDLEIDTGGPDGVIHYRRLGRAVFQLEGVDCALTVFSLVGYGGGLFVPFGDATSGKTTYGGGRYLFDTIKNHIPMPPPAVGDYNIYGYS